MSKDIRNLSLNGNNYAANRQWSNAMFSFARVLDQLYAEASQESGNELDIAPEDLSDALQDLAKRDYHSARIEDAPEVLSTLREQLAKCYPEQEQGICETTFVSAFRGLKDGLTTGPWTVVYGHQEIIELGELENSIAHSSFVHVHRDVGRETPGRLPGVGDSRWPAVVRLGSHGSGQCHQHDASVQG